MALYERRVGLTGSFKDIKADTRENALKRANEMARQLYGDTPHRVELTFAQPEATDSDGNVIMWRFDAMAHEQTPGD